MSTRILVGAEEGGVYLGWKATVLTGRPGASKRVAPKEEWQQGQASEANAFLVLKGKVVAIAALEEIVK